MGEIGEGGVGVLELEEEPKEDVGEHDLELHLQVSGVKEGGREGGREGERGVSCGRRGGREGWREGGGGRTGVGTTRGIESDPRPRTGSQWQNHLWAEEGREGGKEGRNECLFLVITLQKGTSSSSLPPSLPPMPLTSRHLQQRQAQVIADEGKEGGAGREGGTGRFQSLADETQANQAGGLVVGVSGRGGGGGGGGGRGGGGREGGEALQELGGKKAKDFDGAGEAVGGGGRGGRGGGGGGGKGAEDHTDDAEESL
jgi:hypothetical protein